MVWAMVMGNFNEHEIVFSKRLRTFGGVLGSLFFAVKNCISLASGMSIPPFSFGDDSGIFIINKGQIITATDILLTRLTIAWR